MGRETVFNKEFDKLYRYEGELGVNYSVDKSKFSLWAPTANNVKVALYGTDGYKFDCKPVEIIDMNKLSKGVWEVEIDGDLNGHYYNYIVEVQGIVNELVDPYAKAVGVNGKRGMVLNLETTNPEGWDNDRKPELQDITDSIIYEAHIRDLSIDETSGIDSEYKGKFKALTVKNSYISNSEVKTVVNHIKDMGFTHIHLLPSFDYASVDETKLNIPQFNWGYDPQNYNVPEGSYSTNPYLAEVRIKEFKEMVKSLHEVGIRVVMDVVYNHTFNLDSNLNKAVPGYYYRQDENGKYSDASACGNETASDRYMFRKYMIDSVVYWAKEYHIDGFRFDLMGIHDIETMKLIREELNKIDPTIIVYGEGWMGGPSPLKDEDAALKKNTYKFENLQIAAFSDDCRDGVKGHVFYEEQPGFVNGKHGLEETIKFSIVASTPHKDVSKDNIIYSDDFWANEPYQTVTYASAHDNYTLWDKLQVVSPECSEKELIAMNKLIAGIILTSQGISFIHAGEEMARTKVDKSGKFVENSFNSSDEVNKIVWSRKEKYNDLVQYYKGLISLRKKFKAFRMNTNKEIQENISFLKIKENFEKDNIVAYTINSQSFEDNLSKIAVVINANDEAVKVNLKEGNWKLLVDENIAGIEVIRKIDEEYISVPQKSIYVLVK